MSDLKVALQITLSDGTAKPLKGVSANLTGVSKNASAAFGKVGKEAGAAFGNMSKAATAAFGQVGMAVGGASKEFSEATGMAERFGDATERAAEKGSRGIKGLIGDIGKLKEASGAAMKAGAAISAAGAGMAASVAMPIKAAMESEAAMASLKMATMRQDGSNPEWDAIGPTIAGLKGRGKGGTEISEIAAGLLAGGLGAGAINNGALEQAVALSLVGKIDNGAAGELLAKLSQNAGTEDFSALADIAARGGHGANIGMGSMLSHLADLNYKGRELGLTGLGATRGYAKLLTGFSMAGMDEGASVSAMSSLIAGLPHIGEKLKHGKGWKTAEAADIQKKYGLGNLTGQLFGADGNILGADGEEKLDNVVQLFHTINEKVGNAQDKMILFREILGESVGDAALNMDWGLLNKANMKMLDQADLAKKQEMLLGTLSMKWAGLRASVGGFMAAAGEPLLAMAGKAIEKVSGLIDKVAAWGKAHPKLTGAVLGSIGIVGSLLVGVGGLVISVGLLGRSMAISVQGLGKWGETLALARGKVKDLGAEAVLAAGKLNLGKMVGGLKPGLKGLLPKFAGVGGAFGFGGGGMFAGLGSASGALSSITSALAAIPGLGWAIAGAIALVAGVVYKYWEPIKGFFSGLWGGIKEGWEGIAGPTFGEFKEAALGVWRAFSGLLDVLIPMKDGQDGVNRAFEIGRYLGWGLMAALKGVFTMAKWVAQGIEAVVIAVATMADLIVQAGKTIWYAVSGQWGKIGEGWKGFGGRFMDRLENSSMNPDRATGATEGLPEGAAGEGTKAAPQAGHKGKGPPIAAGERLAKAEASRQGGKQGGSVTVHYEPKIEFKGSVKEEDKQWFRRQLESHKEEIARMVQGVMADERQWMGVH